MTQSKMRSIWWSSRRSNIFLRFSNTTPICLNCELYNKNKRFFTICPWALNKTYSAHKTHQVKSTESTHWPLCMYGMYGMVCMVCMVSMHKSIKGGFGRSWMTDRAPLKYIFFFDCLVYLVFVATSSIAGNGSIRLPVVSVVMVVSGCCRIS